MTDNSQVKILVVDDEEPIRRTLARVMEAGGYKDVTTVGSAQDALLLVVNDEFHLMLTDMEMPGESGLELLRKVRDCSPETATMMVTGRDDAKLAESALSIGAFGYIIKPFKRNEVLINVNNALRRRALEIENSSHRDRLEGMVSTRTKDLWLALNKIEAAKRDVTISRNETIHRLALAGEFRDDETGQHVKRMSLYTEVLANASDLEQSAGIREAASLHDIGKIGIPDSILLKPTGLTAEERVIMQRHAEIGYQILSRATSPLLNLAAKIASTHHERMDGSGYPSGLEGHDIPLEGRIVAIADVFDALTTDRVYRPAFPVGVAVEMMKSSADAHLDGHLLGIFWNVFPRILNVKEQFEPAAIPA